MRKGLNVPVPKEVEQSIYSQEATINQHQSDAVVGNDLPTILTTDKAAVPSSTSDTKPPTLQKTEPSVMASPISPPPAASRRKNSPLLIALIALLIIASIGAGLGAFFLFKNGSAISSSQFTGQAYFLSSGRADLTKQHSPGIWQSFS